LHIDDAGRLWVTVDGGGLFRFDDPAADRPHVVRYARAEGLMTDVLLSVISDADGRIYVTGARGIDRLDPTTGTIKHYSTTDGLPGGEFTCAMRDRAGALWFCTTTGLSR